MSWQFNPRGLWFKVPWYHPRRWVGYTWRQVLYPASMYDGIVYYNYQTTQQRARDVLREKFDDRGDAGGRSEQGPMSPIVVARPVGRP